MKSKFIVTIIIGAIILSTTAYLFTQMSECLYPSSGTNRLSYDLDICWELLVNGYLPYSSEPEPEPRLSPEPPSIKMSEMSESIDNFEIASNYASLDWVREPSYIPDSISLKSINLQDSLMYVTYGNDSMEISDSLRENVENGVVIAYFKDAQPWPDDDWTANVQEEARESKLVSEGRLNGKTVKLINNPGVKNEAFYRDGYYTVSVMSKTVDADKLMRILSSMYQ